MSEFNLDNYYKTNLIIWGAIIFAVFLLIGFTYFLDINNTYEPIEYVIEVKNLLFILILIAAIAVLFLKRSLLNFDKVFSKIKNKENTVSPEDYFNKIKSNYIIIWAVSESIIILGFVEFVLLASLKSFLLYAAIGLYALAINFPKKSLFEKHLQLLSEN